MVYRKYYNKKVIIDGIKFDSKKESQYYLKLKMLEKAGKIKDLKCEVKVLVTYKINNKKHKVYYIIYENKVVYFIHRASKYHHIEVCKEFEEAKMINICINNI